MKRLHLFLLTSPISALVVGLFHYNILLNLATEFNQSVGAPQPRHYCEDNEGDLIIMTDYWLGLAHCSHTGTGNN